MGTYVEDAANHTHDLLFVREVEDLGDVLDHVEFEVLEQRQGEAVVAEDPEAACDVVGDLGVFLALVQEELLQNVESTLLHEFFSERVDFKQVHQAEGVGLTRKHGCLVVLLLEQVVQEVGGLFLVFVDSSERDEHGEGVGSHVTLRALIVLSLLLEVAIEDADAVELLISVVTLLDFVQELYAHSAILNDAVDESKGPTDQLGLATDQADDVEESSEKGLDSSIVLGCVQEISLVLVAQVNELTDRLAGTCSQLTGCYKQKHTSLVRYIKRG